MKSTRSVSVRVGKRGDTLKVLTTGTVNVDILLVGLDRISPPAEVTYLEREVAVSIGGHPVDVGIDLVKLGVDPQQVGTVVAVGNGLFGDYVRKVMQQNRLAVFVQEVEITDTGKNVVLEQEGEDRRFHIDPGASWHLDPGFVIEKIREFSPGIFCVRPGYCGIDLHLEDIFREVKARDCFLFLDIMQFHPKRPRQLLLPFFRYADAVHCNEKEAMVNTGKNSPGDAVGEILRRGAKSVFLTKGDRGAEFIAGNHRIVQSGFAVDFVDATGAGDAFCAGVVCKLMELDSLEGLHELDTKTLTDMLMIGQAVGASATTAAGCVEGVSRELVERLLAEQRGHVLDSTKVESI